MRIVTDRVMVLGVALAGLALALFSVAEDVAAQKAIQVQIGPPDPVPPENNRELVEKLSYPEDRDTSQKFEAVSDYLKAKEKDWATVVKLSQGLLDAKSDYFYQYPDKRRVSVKDEMSRMIGTFPKDGRDFYQLTFGPTAETMLKDAKLNGGLDILKLTEVSQKYFHTKAGAEAALLLASLNLELGNFPEAAYGFQRFISRPDTDIDARTLFKAVVAYTRAGDGKLPESALGLWDQIEKKIPREGVKIGNRLLNLDDMKVEAKRPIEFLFGKVGDTFVAMHRGNVSRSGVADASAPFLDPVFGGPILFRTEGIGEKEGAKWVDQHVDAAYKQSTQDKKKVLIPAGFPVTAPNLILYRGYDGIYAFYSKDCIDPSGRPRHAGDIAWFSPTRGGAQTLFSDEDESARKERPVAQAAWQSFWNTQMPSILFENSLLGSMSHDGKLAYFVDDLAVLPQPTNFANDPWGGGFPQPGMSDGGRGMKDYNRLIAVDIDSGSVTWSLGGLGAQLKSEEEDKVTLSSALTENSYFLGPPLPLNGKLYVLFERLGSLRLACLDPQKMVTIPGPPGYGAQPYPELLWVQNLGKTNTPLKQDPFRRIQGAFLASADGVIVCPTNSGALIAVDINARSLLWAHTYSTIDKSNTNPRFIGRRPLPQQMGSAIAQDRWRSSAPIISGNRVILSAYDCDQLQCLDLRSGKLLWSEPRRIDDLYVGGVSGNRILIVGKSYVRSVMLNSGNKEDRRPVDGWKVVTNTGLPTGHGVVSKNGLYFLPVVGEPDNKDSQLPSVWAINVETGAVVSKTAFRSKKELGRPNVPGSDPRLSLGNLVFHDGLMFSQTALEMNAFPLIDKKKEEMTARLKDNPDDPEGLTSRGELSLDEGKLAEAIADLKKAQSNISKVQDQKPFETTSRKIRQKLYFAYTEILRNRFEDGESFLKEYEGLCEVPVDSDMTAPEKARQIEEQVRRKGLFYSLVAKGREKQGKLVDAFENYRAFALLGEQKQLLPVPDDPSTMARSDVWARGRIDAMFRNAKDPANRKPLDEKIDAEWQVVKTANDLPRLRDFVKVFGPYFATGRDAQFLLAQKLLQTSVDADIREAQSLLFDLWAIGEDEGGDRNTAARAVDLLARAMVRRGMMEDSVGLYGILGTRFADVAIRDGKTGGEIYGELVTDKRYLPYLEPTRGVSLSQYKVEGTMGNSGANRPNTYSITPDGELLPFFKRFRITLESDPNSGWIQNTLRVTDRVTGEERCKFPGLMSLQTINGFPITPSRYKPAQAAGHMLMVHAGQFVYCYDLSEKNGKELWKFNLLGSSTVVQQGGWSSENSPDGDLIVGPANGDNWRFRMGHSAVLQPGYATILTRDGLVTVDPKTGTKLWTRANVSPKAYVTGDARYIYLVETSSTGNTSKVLRAIDGAQVDGVKDFGSLLTNADQLHSFGRQILVRSTSIKDGLKLRLYDILDGKDLWMKEFPEGSRAIRSLDPETVGVLNNDGKIEVVATRTGKTLLSDSVAPNRLEEHLKENGKFVATQPVMLADAERFYIFLSKATNNENQQNWWGYQFIKTLPVSGPCYCFDRNTGKRLWYTDEQLKDQQIITERFDELPVIVAANHNNNETGKNPNPGNPAGQKYQVVAIDKKSGMLKYMNFAQPGSQFQSVWQDTKTGAVEFWQWNYRVRITPDESKK